MSQNQQQAQQAMMQLPILASVADFHFNPQGIIAIDFSEYSPGKPDRVGMLHLISEVEHEFTDERADAFYAWYLQIWGSVQLAQNPLIT